MPQVQVKTRVRRRETASADPPTINRKIAQTWFPDSQEPLARRDSSSSP